MCSCLTIHFRPTPAVFFLLLEDVSNPRGPSLSVTSQLLHYHGHLLPKSHVHVTFSKTYSYLPQKLPGYHSHVVKYCLHPTSHTDKYYNPSQSGSRLPHSHPCEDALHLLRKLLSILRFDFRLSVYTAMLRTIASTGPFFPLFFLAFFVIFFVDLNFSDCGFVGFTALIPTSLGHRRLCWFIRWRLMHRGQRWRVMSCLGWVIVLIRSSLLFAPSC